MTTPPRAARFGSWTSPISIASVLAASTGLSDVHADGGDAYWLESRPGQDGRLTLVRWRDGVVDDLTPAPINVRSRVMEYGGGAYDVRAGVVVCSDDATRSLLRLDVDGAVAITPASADVRFGDVRVHPDRGLVLSVREDHRGAGEAVTTLVALDLFGDNDDFGRVLASGADFYANPELSGDQLAWIEWNHPDMPWDATVLKQATLTEAGLVDVSDVMGGPGTSVQHPRWTPDGRLVALSDETGFWAPRVVGGGGPALSGDADHPMWVLGNASMGFVGADRALIAWYDDGRRVLGWWDVGTGGLGVFGEPVGDVDSIASSEGVAWVIVDLPDRAQEVWRLVPGAVQVVVRKGSEAVPDPSVTSRPESLWFEGRSGPTQAWFYPPVNGAFTGEEGERPPVIVKSHGGPTGFAAGTYSPAVQYWTSRGFAVLDVNYSGSAGFGRAYRERLKGRWGIADVQDCEEAVRAAASAGLVDAERAAITGGSAGGYTTLQALVTSRVFAAGVSSYGIGDLAMLATDTHKFESRYLDGLIGPYPQARATYDERSPILHVDRLGTPMLILQGLDDRVVPPNQAQDMADAVRSKGLPVALLLFEGEGHGFRKESTRARVLEAQQSFFAQIFGYTPADDVPLLDLG